MSIYDNLGNSDFMDAGKFKEQLKQMDQMKESQESANQNFKDQPFNQADSIDNFGLRKNEESERRQKLIQEQNPMDQENESDIEAPYKLPLDDGVSNQEHNDKFNAQFNPQAAKNDRLKFEKQTKNRISLMEDNLLNDLPGQAYEDNHMEHLVEQRNKMIFDDNLEMSERNTENGPVTLGQPIKAGLKQSLIKNPYENAPQVKDANSQIASQGFTLNKYESKPDIQKDNIYSNDGPQVQTGHFNKQGSGKDSQPTFSDHTQKTENPDKDQMMIDQRGFQNGTYSEEIHENQKYLNQQEGTGQFGGMNKGKGDERENVRNVEVDQFNHVSNQSPKLKQSQQTNDDQLNALLAQLQAPLDKPHLASQIQSQFDIDKAHQQMQESIKQMKLTEGASDQINLAATDGSQMEQSSIIKNGAGPFNGQNSLYELANRVGHPLTSSNLQSVSNYEQENDFQKFLQGEGSINSAQTNNYNNYNNQFGLNSQGTNENKGYQNNHAQEQNQQLLIQMQDSGNSNPDFQQRPLPDYQQRPSLALLKNKVEAENQLNYNKQIMEKENFNGRNIISQPVDLRSQSNYNSQGDYQTAAWNDKGKFNQNQNQNLNNYAQIQYQQAVNPPQQQQPKMMSLAARAAMAKMNKQQDMMGQPPVSQFQKPQVKHTPLNEQYQQVYLPQIDDAQKNLNQNQMVYHQTQQPQIPTKLPQIPYQGQNVDFSRTNKMQKAEKRAALLANFDDIPIHQLHKADGYQLRNIDDEDPTGDEGRPSIGISNYNSNYNQNFDGTNENLDQMAVNKNLSDRVFDPKWKVRWTAFKEINQLFLNYQPKQGIQKEDEMYGDPENPFDQYGNLLEQMLKDQNLTAQYEGLNCLLSFVTYGSDIKSVVFSCTPVLLDKIQHNKPNLKDVSQKILLQMIQRKQNMVPELLKRVKSKNSKAAIFCIEVLVSALQNKHLSLQDANLKLIFKSTEGLLGHSLKEIRDTATELLAFIYENCEDDLETFCHNVKGLRPVQLQEFKDKLSSHQKNMTEEYLVKLFDKVTLDQLKRDGGPPERSPIGRSKSTEKQEEKPIQGVDEGVEDVQIDLSNLVQDNFNEIPYINQINLKRKSMEVFNQELSNLVQKQANLREDEEGIVKLNKDYSQIFNIITHILEDPNMLVFIEAIKTIENLAILLKQTIKSSKMKQFLKLLADKYKETKTAVLTSLETCFDAIFENKCLPATQFFDLLINNIATTHKNPRVKQLVLDRVELIIEKNYMDENHKPTNNSQLGQVFKQNKDKLKQIILKDTNAGVRDAGVSLLALFRIVLGSEGLFIDFEPVLEVINSLPKQRVSEITNRLEIFQETTGKTDQIVSARDRGSISNRSRSKSREGNNQRGPRGVSAKSGGRNGAKFKSQERQAAGASKQGDHAQDQPDINESSQSVPGSQKSSKLFETKRAQASTKNEYQASLSDIILTIKNISQDRDRLRTVQIVKNLENGLEDLGNEGVLECKGHIVMCIYWLLTNYPRKINFLEPERQEATKAILNFIKKLYCIERSFSRVQLTPKGESKEMFHTISSSIICYAIIQENFSDQIAQNLNVLHSAAMNTEGESTLSFLNVLKVAMTQHEPLINMSPNSQVMIMSNTIYYLSDKCQDFLQQSQATEPLNEAIQIEDIEAIRPLIVDKIEQCEQEEDKRILIQSLIYFKDKMNQARQNQITNMAETGQGFPQTEGMPPQEQPQIPQKKRYEEVIELIESNFEQGLLKMKELVKDEQTGNIQIHFEQKQQIILLLLHLTTKGYTNPQEQYKQAYSLKALMWLKDEFIGLEETYKIAPQVLQAYSKSIIDEKDSSIEKYLLNFWIKDLSLRDLIDRIQQTIKMDQQIEKEVFDVMFTWLVQNKIVGEVSDTNSQFYSNWLLEDFKKLASLIASNYVSTSRILDQEGSVTHEFFKESVTKFGAKKVRDFMEIQLIHDNQLLLRFLDKFDVYHPSQENTQNQHIKIAKNNNDSELSQALFNGAESMSKDQTLQEPLLTNRSNVGDITDRSQLLKEMRDKRKENKRGDNADESDFQSTLADEKKKYEEIMSRLDKYKSKGQESKEGITPRDGDRVEIDSREAAYRSRISNTSNGIRPQDGPGARPVSGRYLQDAHRLGTDGATSLDEFGDEDFKLSTDNHQSIANMAGLGGSNLASVPELGGRETHEDHLNVPKLGARQQVSSKSTKVFGDGLKPEPIEPASIEGHSRMNSGSAMAYNSNSDLQESRQKIRESVQYQEERMQRLESSQIKVRQFKTELETLELEKKRLEMEKQILLNEQNKETEQWRQRYTEMTKQNDEVALNLAEANQGYLRQVSDNEKLTQQIQSLQEAHQLFLQRYKDMEARLVSSEKQIEEQKIQLEESQGRSQLPNSPGRMTNMSSKGAQVVEEQQLHKIEQAFDKNQMMKYGENISQAEVGIRRVQELLLDNEGSKKDLAKGMIMHYQKLKGKVERMQMIHALKESLENEDILFAISNEVYKSLINFLLRAFSFEKELIERESLQSQHERENQNELTQEAQRLVSKLLNSKEFTTSLNCLMALLRVEAMPDDFSTELTISERQYLRVLMRCITRITKALHSENPDLVRAFDVLIEMHKLFVKHPPENLRQDQPCLQDFDFVFRSLKEVSDKLIELQPQKCQAFLKFVDQQSECASTDASEDSESLYSKPNAFTKYLKQMMQANQYQQ